LEADGVGGDRVGDVRVAVAVAADPRPEPEERGRPAAVGVRVRAGQPRLQLAVHLRHHVEQPRLDHREQLLHLVEHRRPGRAHRVGEPQRLHLLGQRGVQRVALGRGGLPVLQPVEQGGDRGQLLQDRSAAAPRSGAR
jgi:hypothetical protein